MLDRNVSFNAEKNGAKLLTVTQMHLKRPLEARFRTANADTRRYAV